MIMIQVKDRKIPYTTAKLLPLLPAQHLDAKKKPKKPVKNATPPAPTRMPNETFLKLFKSVLAKFPCNV